MQVLSCKDFLVVLFALAAPLPLMLISPHDFERGLYTSQLSLVLIFVVAVVLASATGLDRVWIAAAFVIVVIGMALNLYELFVENNRWSEAPGRSAGFYLNPNITGQALVGYALAFLVASRASTKTASRSRCAASHSFSAGIGLVCFPELQSFRGRRGAFLVLD